ncbi:MAG TPA: ribosome maturation factor RimM [Solirubrobacteraceae bacterium]|nr:ribosome maturation factor RimM [Solirubrobacteraceae bacterium]
MAALDVLNAGRVGRPHGLDGSFHVTRPRPALLPLGGEVRVGETAREIVRRAGTDDRPILRLQGVDDRAGAEALRGEDLFVARSAAPTLGAGEYWAEDLRGCRVVTAGDRELGVVDELRALPSCEVLEVGELLVPLVRDAVIAVDVASRRIIVDARFLGLEEVGGPEPGPRAGQQRAPSDASPAPHAPPAPGVGQGAPAAAEAEAPAAPEAPAEPPAAPEAPAEPPGTEAEPPAAPDAARG